MLNAVVTWHLAHSRRRSHTEKDIERRLRKGVEALGGVAYKFTSPGQAGVPDRLVLLPGGRAVFVELKTDAGRLSRLQVYQIGRLRALGCDVRVLQGETAVEAFLKEVRSW